MALETKLSPPILDTKIPAFAGSKLTVPFGMNRAVSLKDFDKIAIIVKSAQTNLTKMEYTTSNYYYDSTLHCYCADFDIDAYNKSTEINKFEPLPCQFYKVQIAYVSTTGIYGYYSTAGIIKCTTLPKVIIQELSNGNNRHSYEYTGVYSQEDGDITEKVYSYCFNLYDDKGELVAASGEQLHDSSTDIARDKSTDVFKVRKNLFSNIRYEIEYNVTTLNGLKASSGRYQISETETAAPNIHAQLYATCSYDEGYVTLTLIGDRSGKHVSGHFVLLRSSSEDNFDTWQELTKFDLSFWDSNTDKVICKDYTVRQGDKYIYAIRAYNSIGLFSDKLLNVEGQIQCDFEDAFLFDGKRQLKIRFNPKISNFKSTVLETKTNTIGGKYPFIFRNGNVEYKEFSISGLLSLLGDANDEFKTGLPAKEDEILHDQGHWLTTDNIRKEREFKIEVLNWLTNGKPKLFKSPTEGNFIIRLTNVSLTPNDTIGRVLHTFNSQASEIAEFNFSSLKQYGFTSDEYTEARTLRFTEVDLTNIQRDEEIVIPAAAIATIYAVPLVNFDYSLQRDLRLGNGSTGHTGVYQFPESVLSNNPLMSIKLLSDSWGEGAKLVYGYYDAAIDTFSRVYDISMTDEFVQLLGKGMEYNLMDDFQDIRTTSGAVSYLRVQPRDTMNIYRENGKFYYNNNRIRVEDLLPNTIYYVFDGFSQDASNPQYFIDGRDGHVNNATVYPIDKLDFSFKVTGTKDNQTIDFNGLGNTTGRYEALRELSDVKDLYAGNGIIIDMLYQKKTITYIVEVPESEYYREAVITAKNAWEIALKTGYGNPEVLYETYLSELQKALDELGEVYDVEYAL